jgi:ribonuclease T2
MSPKRIGKVLGPLILLSLALLLAQWQPGDPAPVRAATTAHPGSSTAASFDYYLIALSWSPTWCESHPRDTEQCARRGFGFVLHGLWPQFERGGGPQDCQVHDRPSRATIERSLAFMPSRSLIEHQWRSHGACSGMDADAYFDLADRAYASIRTPRELSPSAKPVALSADALRRAFLDANPQLAQDGLAVICHSGKLAEVRICVDTDLQPRRCGRGVRMQCPRESPVRIPRIR